MKNLKNRKTIHVFTKYFIPTSAGREVNIYETYSKLVKQGWGITIHTSKSTHEARNVLPDRSKLGGIKVIRHLEKSYVYPLWVKKLHLSGSIICFHGLEYFPDVLILLYFLYLKILGKKDFVVIFSSHGLYSLRYQFDKGISGILKRLIDKLISIHILNNVGDGYRAISKWEAKYMRISGIKNIHVILNGLPEEAFKKNNKLAPKSIERFIRNLDDYIIQVGRIDRSKNYEAVIKSLSFVNNKKLNFLIVGPVDDFDYKKELDKLIEDLNLGNRVYFSGAIMGPAKYLLMKNSKIYIQMSWSEGFGNTVYEAMNQGSVCIVSRATALSEIVKDGTNGFTLSPTDYTQIASTINFILDKKNKKYIEKMKLNNKLFAGYRTLKSVALKVEKFYLEVLSRK